MNSSHNFHGKFFASLVEDLVLYVTSASPTMASSPPAHIAAVRGIYRGSPSLQKQRQKDGKVTMNKVKQLYFNRNFKQCAALCEEALKDYTEVRMPAQVGAAALTVLASPSPQSLSSFLHSDMLRIPWLGCSQLLLEQITFPESRERFFCSCFFKSAPSVLLE